MQTVQLALLCLGRQTQNRVAELIRRKCFLKCNINGYAMTALLDPGAQVSIIDQAWKRTYLPDQHLRPLSLLMGSQPLHALPVNGVVLRFDRWVTVATVIHSKVIQDPFLVDKTAL